MSRATASDGTRLAFDIFGKLQDQPCISAGGRERRLAADGILGAAGERERQAGDGEQDG